MTKEKTVDESGKPDDSERELGTTEDVIAVAKAFQNLDLVFLMAGYSPFGMY